MTACSVCKASPATPCTGCHSANYCGKECQKKDWKLHKTQCKAFKVVYAAEEHGRSIVAARDVKAGEVLIKATPLAVGPRMHNPTPSPLPCLGCYKVTRQLLKCNQCQLPVCSQRCSESKNHSVECRMVAEARAAGHEFSIGVPAVTPLRLIALKTTRPKDFETALSMEANLEVLRERPLWSHLQKHVAEPIMAMQMEGVLREEVEHLMGALLTNAFEVMVQDSLLFGLFFEPALMNHHCVGNTRLMLDGQHTMTVLASLPVKKNAQVKFNYGRALDPTLTRQTMLLENKFFSCRCDRCLDPTELASHTSSLRCVPPCDGTVLPKDSVIESSWGCTKCGLEREASEVGELLAGIAVDMERLDRNNLKAVRQVVNKYSDKLHKNNGVMVELKQIVVSGLGRLPGFEMQDLTESDHKEKIIFCDEVLTVLNRVEPGLTLGRGLMLFEMHSSLVMVANMEFERRQNSGQLLSRLLEADKILREAAGILQLEAAGSPYGHLAATVQHNIAALSQYIESVKNM